MVEEKKCFIIMPISTPEFMLEKYRDGKDHFKHVLHCLFVPSVQKAGYQAIPPIAKGADLIHAEIVGNLETAEIVLCDMSCLNPNVFFEFGIRTSLNKPVCVVKDELAESIPFDTAILNYHEYKSSLEPWDLEGEINALSDHIVVSVERGKGENSLWKYFGLKTSAAPYEGEGGTDAKLDYIGMKLDSLSKQIGSREGVAKPQAGGGREHWAAVLTLVNSLLSDEARALGIRELPEEYLVAYRGRELSADERAKVGAAVRAAYGKSITLVKEK